MSKDLMQRLRAADPAARLAPVADDAMREAIMTTHVTTDQEAQAARGRRVRRGLISGGLATVLVGGGVAYAAVVNDWHRGTGPMDGLTCLTQWGAPEEERSGGSVLTGDVVADCQQYQALTGLPVIEDPVAFRFEGVLYVTPRGEVPDGARLEPVDPQALALHELETSLGDWVDGLGAQCLDEAGAVAAARAELDRLGLGDWTVRVQEPDPSQSEECADITYAYDVPEEALDNLPKPGDGTPASTPEPAGTEVAIPTAERATPTAELATPTAEEPTVASSTEPAPVPGQEAGGQVPRTLAVIPHSRAPRDSLREHTDASMFDLRDTLRAQIADECVDLDEAERIATEAVGADIEFAPLVVIEDPQADCTRVDLRVGGSFQVLLRGARP